MWCCQTSRLNRQLERRFTPALDKSALKNHMLVYDFNDYFFILVLFSIFLFIGRLQFKREIPTPQDHFHDSLKEDMSLTPVLTCLKKMAE